MTSEQPDVTPQLKKSKVDNDTESSIVTGKENLPLKTYPKRNRKLSLKGILCVREGNGNAQNVDNSTSISNHAAELVDNLTNKLDGSSGDSAEPSCATPLQLDVPTSSKSKAAKAKAAASKSKGKAVKSNSPQPTNAEASSSKKKRCMPKTVDKLLDKMGIEADDVSCCLKAAMGRGFYKISGDPSDLEQIVIEGEYDGHTFKVLVKDLLYQPDYAGLDYEDGLLNATALCMCCTDDRGRAYVTRICTGQPEFDCGKFHNHCTECKGFGKCIGDYREAHCFTCNKHWFAGLSGFPCSNCEQKRKRASMDAFMERARAGEFKSFEDLLEASNEDCSLM